MNRILLKRAKIYDQASSHHLKVRDILIEDGRIVDIKATLKPEGQYEVVESKELSVSPGWVDIGAFNGEPGKEQREDLNSLRRAAANGGYVGLAPFPTGAPTADTKGQIEFLLSRNPSQAVQVYPIAALTQNRNGKDMAELLDLYHAGAVAFSDGQGSVMGEGQIQRSLLYLKGINANLIYVVNSKKPHEDGQVNEGVVSVSMGVEGIPAHQEKVAVNTVLRQIDYTGARALIHNISLAWSANRISKAQQAQYDVEATVTYFNLSHGEQAVAGFNNNFKVLPPLRDEIERKKLCRAVARGKIDIITSNHNPQTVEEKDEPFGMSVFGASSIETTFSSLLTYTEGISVERMVYCLSTGPRLALGIASGTIVKGAEASITMFDPSMEREIYAEHLQSKSKNNPYIGQKMKGMIIGIINNALIVKTNNL